MKKTRFTESQIVTILKQQETGVTEKNKQSRKIVSNVSGEATVISPDRKFVFDQTFLSGKLKKILYSVEKGKYTVLEISDDFLSANPFFSRQKRELVLYDVETMEMKAISY